MMKRYTIILAVFLLFCTVFTFQIKARPYERFADVEKPWIQKHSMDSKLVPANKGNLIQAEIVYQSVSEHSDLVISPVNEIRPANRFPSHRKSFFAENLRASPPVVPVAVDKYAVPVANPMDPENPNAWDVTLKITTKAVTVPVDVVMVIDQSSSMGGQNIARLKSAIASGQRFVKKMLPKGMATEGVRIALVSYDHEPHRLSDFTKDTAFLCQKIRALTPIWGTHTQGGVKMARNIMATSTAVDKHIILMSDGLATEQYPVKNVTTADFIGETGNANDPIDLVIQGAINFPTNYVSNNPSTPLTPNYPTHSSKVGRRNLPESKFDYSNLSARITFDGVAGALVYEPRFPHPYYYYFPCNAAINEAQFAKNSGYTIHTIGYDLGDFALANNSLKLTATDENHFFTATPANLAAAFDNIAQTINIGIQRGEVTDFVAPGFIVKNLTQSGDVTHLLNVSNGTVHYDVSTKKLTWTTGTILSSSEATITYRIYADLDYIQNNDIPVNTTSAIGPDLGGFDTNTEAKLTYTNSNGEPNQQLIFPRPTVKLGYGVIKRHYVLVNKDGQPIQANGTVVSSLSEAHVLQSQDFFLPSGGGHIVPKWIKLDKTTEALQYYSVPPTNTVITTADGKRYRFVEVPGSTPNPGQIGISWKKPAGNAYFAYKLLNYWMGGTTDQQSEWDVTSNWTGAQVPLTGEDVEFATTENFGSPAVADLHVPTTNPKIIGNLINNSDKDLVVTTSSQLTINGVVEDNNPNVGTIVVKSSKDNPTGTLLFANPGNNQNVGGTVEFYNQGYDCADCGMYRRSWQYFGIPVNESGFPINDVAGNETVNQWVEPFNGDKWRPAPYTPDTKLQKFKGYQITNDVQAQPTGVYSFKGTLCVCDAFLNLTRTSGVNYSGANLIGNSYTGAIDIKQGIVFPPEVEQTVYLFNTGTRDQWRKLNGSTVSGYRAGQYLSVPKNTAGQDNLPDRIPSMHSFLVKMQNGASCTLQILYDKLLKNTTVNNGNGTQIAWRSGNSGSANMPSLVMDVLGNESADRLWIFTDGGLSFGFDNGWDGRKLTEKGLSQLYAMSDIGNDKFQVAGVPELNNLLIGFDADKDGQYTLEFALSDHFAKGAVYLHDLQSGAKHRITNSTSYSFDAKRGDSGARFRLSYGCDENVDDSHVVSTNGREIIILNQDALDCTVTLFTIEGKLLRRLKVLAGHREVMKVQTGGAYIVHLQNAFTNDVHKVLVEY
ncbi:VWA domain-containing protein [Porphyromonas gingivalis]|uniref:minor fimbrial subunit Mfa5 n=1 Tax=Porphyromonas gingivalis TaxID=837 RepID=UPI000C17D94A|nr:minor fimbrial subunit Mfa5 [Porphyromonas gingivalis]ATR90434.1 VWA domain-containing protein [Porphyromonas gingivalis]